jgi:hypothetical protein
VEGALELLLGVHHDWPVPSYRFAERLSRDQQKTDALVPGLYGDFVAAVKNDQRAIVCLNRRIGV